jgi:FAD-linked oxidoreductase
MAAWRNWSGHLRANPKVIAQAGTAEALSALIRAAEGPIRAVGSGHSFTPIAATDGTMLRLPGRSTLIDWDRETQRARVSAGTTIHDLGPALFDAGLGLINQGDIDAQTIAGAVSTGTHGTGANLGAISTQIIDLQLVTADGQILVIDGGDSDLLSVARLSLGLLGVILELTLQLRPAYALEERQWLLSTDHLERDVPKLLSENRHFEFFWFPHADAVICKTLNPVYEEPPLRMAVERGLKEHAAMTGCSLIAGLFPTATPALQRWITSQISTARRVAWSHQAFSNPRLTRFNEMEVAVPRERSLGCLTEIADYLRRCENVFFPLEFRTVADDDIAISPFFERPSATIAIHHHAAFDPRKFFAGAADIFRRYGGRPHWGKMHWLNATTAEALYPKMDLFREIVRKLDPKGRFRTPYLSALFGLG